VPRSMQLISISTPSTRALSMQLLAALSTAMCTQAPRAQHHNYPHLVRNSTHMHEVH
jgi:hypothetical protein